MKKLEDVKKSLEVCGAAYGCLECQYMEEKASPYGCGFSRDADALFYIEHLDSKLDEAVEDFRMLGRMGANICPVCAHYNHGAGSPEKCPKALKEDCFEWRGV